MGQLAELPEELYELESSALRKLTPGPGMWNIAADLWYLDRAFSFPAAFKSLRFVCWASKLRVALFESIRPSNPWDVSQKTAELWHVLLDCSRFRERTEWDAWYKSSYTLQLQASLDAASALGINPKTFHDHLYREHRQKGCARTEAASLAKGALQRSLHKALLNHPEHLPNFEHRVRHKLSIWKLSIPAGICERRFLANQARLAGLVPPRVHAACWRAAWNGWCIDYRFRNMEGRWWTKPCVLNCTAGAEDRIEHYCQCPHVIQFARHCLGIENQACSLARFLLVDSGMSAYALTLQALLVYAVYRTTNAARHSDSLSPQHIYDMLEEFIKGAARGHDNASRVLHEALRGRYCLPRIPQRSS